MREGRKEEWGSCCCCSYVGKLLFTITALSASILLSAKKKKKRRRSRRRRQNGKTVEGMGITSVGAHSGSFQIRVCFLFMEIPSSLLNGFILVRLLLIFLIQC
jgi:hypothetical protein